MCTRSHFLYCSWRRTGFNLGLISEYGMCCPSYSLSPHFYHFEMYVDGPMGLRWGGSCDCYDYARWGFDEWSLSSSVLSARVKWAAIRNPISTFTVKVRHKFTCSPTHKMLLASTVVSCLPGATWGSRSQEHFNTGGSNRDPRDSWTPSVPPAETACLQNNKGFFLEASGRRFSGCAHPPLVVFLLTAWLFSLLGCWNCVFMSL